MDELIGGEHAVRGITGEDVLDVCISVLHTDGMSHNGGAFCCGGRGVKAEDGLGGMTAGVGGKGSASGELAGLFEFPDELLLIGIVIGDQSVVGYGLGNEPLDCWNQPRGEDDG